MRTEFNHSGLFRALKNAEDKKLLLHNDRLVISLFGKYSLCALYSPDTGRYVVSIEKNIKDGFRNVLTILSVEGHRVFCRASDEMVQSPALLADISSKVISSHFEVKG